MRKQEEIRFDLQTNQNLSRKNLVKAYGESDVQYAVVPYKGWRGIIKKNFFRILSAFEGDTWKNQRQYNTTVANTLEDYDRMHTIMMEENDCLRNMVEQLQFQVAELNQKLGQASVFDCRLEGTRVIQIVSSLNFGDAVGNDVLAINRALTEAGYVTGIFSKSIHKKIKEPNAFLIELLPKLNANDIVIYHYAAADEFQELIEQLDAKVVLRYHNVTPPAFFAPYDKIAEKVTSEGLKQIEEMRDAIDYGMTVSEFNKCDLQELGYECPIAVAPILIPFDDYRQEPSAEVIKKYSDGKTNIVFVGRIAPNKRFEDVIDCFVEYKKNYDENARLFLVGNYDEKNTYYQYLKGYVKGIAAEDVIFPGHIPFNEILAYYKIADLFLCMSEHEGFCVPLVEAMFFETPIVAYASTAIPGTLNGAGVLVENKEPVVVAEKMHQVLTDELYKKEIIEKQNARLADFEYHRIKEQILEEITVIKDYKVVKASKKKAKNKMKSVFEIVEELSQ